MNTFNISNRRYLGNKYKLLDWIKRIVDENCTDIHSFFDVFSGTGSVASAFIDKRLVVCDMMKSNYYAALCWFSPEIIVHCKRFWNNRSETEVIPKPAHKMHFIV